MKAKSRDRLKHWIRSARLYRADAIDAHRSLAKAEAEVRRLKDELTASETMRRALFDFGVNDDPTRRVHALGMRVDEITLREIKEWEPFARFVAEQLVAALKKKWRKLHG